MCQHEINSTEGSPVSRAGIQCQELLIEHLGPAEGFESYRIMNHKAL